MQHYTDTLYDTFGNAISGATVNVYVAGTTTPATIYSDNLGTGTTNPLTTGSDGSYDFYAANGRYDLVITHPGHTFSSADTAGIALYDPDNDAQTLDWTISLGGTASYSLRDGKYRKIGRLVFVQGRLIVNTIGTGSATTISGLPFSAAENAPVHVGYFSGVATSCVFLAGFVSGTTIIMTGLTASASGVTQPFTTFGNGTQLYFAASYIATS
jgi:hypothetical protein